MAKKIVWSNLAQLELATILEFYIQQNGNEIYSTKLLEKIDNLLVTISQNEFIGRLSKNKITRVFPMDVFLIFYEITDDRIEIISFWDNRQNEHKCKVQ